MVCAALARLKSMGVSPLVSQVARIPPPLAGEPRSVAGPFRGSTEGGNESNSDLFEAAEPPVISAQDPNLVPRMGVQGTPTGASSKGGTESGRVPKEAKPSGVCSLCLTRSSHLPF